MERRMPIVEGSNAEDCDSKQLCLGVLKALENAVTSANELLRGGERELVRATCPDVRKKGNDVGKRVTAAIESIGSRYAVGASGSDGDSTDSGSSSGLVSGGIIFDKVSETIDEALEQFNSALDSARGIQDATVIQSGALGPMCQVMSNAGKYPKRQGAYLEMEKPQARFPDYPIDNSDAPFVPPFADNSNKDDSECGGTRRPTGGSPVGRYLQDLFIANSNPGVGGALGRKHPYADEIKAAAEEMSEKVFKEEEVTVYGSLEKTPCTFVVTEEELFNVAERLKRAVAIAVDIENHSVRSFQGFTCLIQISTRREDFVIDALALRGSIHRALAPIFTDDATVKVLHGADKDVQWLERDFGIYVVNMFDTGQAARLLKYPSAALSYLLARFCNVTGTDKRVFQLADWRQRPLPDAMFEYARSDTHYLLYIYDRLRTELAKKQLTAKAWEKSAAVSQKRHTKIRFDAGTARHLAARYGLGFDQHQTRLLEELCRWRDRTAREDDESLHFVAPLNTLFGIVRARDKARTVEGLMKHGFPSKVVPPMVKSHAEELVRLICDSLDAKLEDHGPDSKAGNHVKSAGTPRSDTAAARAEERTGVTAQDPAVEEDDGRKPSHAETKTGKMTTKDEETNPRPVVELRQVKVSVQSKSALFDLDSSDSSSDDAEPDDGDCESGRKEPEQKEIKDRYTDDGRREAAAVKHEPPAEGIPARVEPAAASEAPAVTAKHSGGGSAPTACGSAHGVGGSAGAEIRTGGDLAEDRNEGCDERRRRVAVKARAAFDFSEDEDEAEARLQRVARVAAGLQLSVGAVAPADFRVETDEVPGNDDVDVCVDGDGAAGGKDGEAGALGKRGRVDEEGEVVSLLRAFGGSGGEGRKRKKRKRGSGEGAARMPAFDYQEAAAKERGAKNGEAEKAFDPLQRLRKGWKEMRRGGAPRRARKRPGSGAKSMSFRSRK